MVRHPQAAGAVLTLAFAMPGPTSASPGQRPGTCCRGPWKRWRSLPRKNLETYINAASPRAGVTAEEYERARMALSTWLQSAVLMVGLVLPRPLP